MQSINIGTWLLQQTPTIVVLGVAVVVLWRSLNSERTRNNTLSDDVIKITTLWESKASDLGKAGSEERTQILTHLQDIKTLLLSKPK